MAAFFFPSSSLLPHPRTPTTTPLPHPHAREPPASAPSKSRPSSPLGRRYALHNPAPCRSTPRARSFSSRRRPTPRRPAFLLVSHAPINQPQPHILFLHPRASALPNRAEPDLHHQAAPLLHATDRPPSPQPPLFLTNFPCPPLPRVRILIPCSLASKPNSQTPWLTYPALLPISDVSSMAVVVLALAFANIDPCSLSIPWKH